MDLKVSGVGSKVEFGDLGSVEFDITMTAKTQPCNLLNMDITLEGTITFGLGDTKQKTCGVSSPVGLTTFLASMYAGDVKFPNIQHCLYDAIKIADTTGTAAPLLKPDDTSGKTTLTIPQQAFTIAAGDDLVKYLKFSTAAVLKLLPLPPVVAIGTAMEATGTDVVWSIPASSLVTQFTGVQFQIQAEAMILNQDNLKTMLNPALSLVGLGLPLLDWKVNTLGMALYFLTLVSPDQTLPGFICPQGNEGCKAAAWETSTSKLPKVGSFVIGHTSKACSKATADFEINLLGITSDNYQELPAAIAKWQNEQLSKGGSKFTVPDCSQKSMGGDMGGDAAAVETAVCLVQGLKFDPATNTVSGTMHPGANFNAGGFMQLMAAGIEDDSFSLTVGSTPIKADPSVARKLPSCSAADLAEAKAAGAEFACGTVAMSADSSSSDAAKNADMFPGQGGGLGAGGLAALAMFVTMIAAAFFVTAYRMESSVGGSAQDSVVDPAEAFKDPSLSAPKESIAL